MSTDDPSATILEALAGLRSCAYCRELLTSEQHERSPEHLARCAWCGRFWRGSDHPADSPLLGGSFRCDGSYRLGGPAPVSDSYAPVPFVASADEFEALMGRGVALRRDLDKLFDPPPPARPVVAGPVPECTEPEACGIHGECRCPAVLAAEARSILGRPSSPSSTRSAAPC